MPEGSVEDFDPRSGSLVERLLFNYRPVILAASVLATLILGWQALGTSINASFERMIPRKHPYIVNFLKHYDELKQHGNAIRVIVEANDGNIVDRGYLDILQQVSRDIAGLIEIDRSFVSSLWSPTTRWIAVTEDGFEGGLVISEEYDGSPAALALVRRNILLSGLVGQMVAPDFRSSIVYAPLRDGEAQTGRPLDYGRLGRELETLRAKYAAQGVTLRITGFGKVVADIIDAQGQIARFFLLSAAISAIALLFYTRCATSTFLVVCCSLTAVLWQLGLIAVTGGVLDPYSILVPFLIFAIGMSHGTQKMNGIMQDIGRGMHRRAAARHTFRRLFKAGLAALLCDAVGFAVLYIIEIDAIRQLAVAASIGVIVLIFTNLILLPVLLSYVGVSRSAAVRSLRRDELTDSRRASVEFVCRFVRRRQAGLTILLALLMGMGALYVSDRHLSIGDLDQGAPELRPDARYNRDNSYLTERYQTSSDLLIVLGEVPSGYCNDYNALERVDELEWKLRQIPAVQSTNSLATSTRYLIAATSEQNFKWFELVHNQMTLNDVFQFGTSTLANASCSLDPIYVYLTDHKTGTLTAVTEAVERYMADNPGGPVKFLLAGGNAGVEAATNNVVSHAFRTMLYWVYGAVALLCLAVFRSWRATLCVLLPLVLTSVLTEALMVWLDIGVKVATLPVVALGVGTGVDYALYLLSITLVSYQKGLPLKEAYRSALLFAGRVMFLTGFALSIGVITWAASPIKFQADMGVLLSFMFLLNMLGALILLPSLASFLLPSASDRT